MFEYIYATDDILSQLERDPIANIDEAMAAQLWALRFEPALYPRSGETNPTTKQKSSMRASSICR